MLKTAKEIPVFEDATLDKTPTECGGDTLDFVDLIVKLEKKFSIRILDKDLDHESQITFKGISQVVKQSLRKD